VPSAVDQNLSRRGRYIKQFPFLTLSPSTWLGSYEVIAEIGGRACG
jgi:hypothetical protein